MNEYQGGRYSSWSGLRNRLHSFLCPQLQGRIRYFLTRYHQVHNAYGRAAVLLDGQQVVCFSWVEMYQQEADRAAFWKETGEYQWESPQLKAKWDQNQNYCEMDFLHAATQFLQMPVGQALESPEYLLKLFAILDRRVGRRTLDKIARQGEYRQYPQWVRQFYQLRLTGQIEKVGGGNHE